MWRIYRIAILIPGLLSGIMAGRASEGPVYVVAVEGMVDKVLVQYIERAIREAEANDAAAIVFRMDTFGGLVVAADQIRQRILDTPIPTIAFINRNAASAGALIAYACDRIVMAPGASIGAATVVEGTTGEAAPDKYQSYMRGLMRATAEANGRDPRIAEAMVDPDVAIEGVVPAGKVLTLSAQEALQLGVADAMAASVEEALQVLGYGPHPMVAFAQTGTERVLRVLALPVLQTLFLLMMLGGLYFELQTPGVGLPGLIALAGALLFFAPNYLSGLVEFWEILLFLAGVGLLLVELLVIPGFGVAGIAGILLMLAGLLAALIGNVGLSFPSMREVGQAIFTLLSALALSGVSIAVLGRYVPRTRRFQELVLGTGLSRAQGYTASDAAVQLTGKQGRTVTPLRPAGMVEIEGKRYDVVASGQFVPAGMPVEVVRVQGNRIEVRPLRDLEGEAS
ncbi:NfeD family protein [Rhodothermus profundi]|uniref:Membrane-bound serine protease (ClpP class) n=1 Tax=Rhodothermus profundi TaxID=633813 RepID=A0A1M6UUH6_9BACT|nr:NfeD family protein [Rhodothermus profundi]SHK72824.1 membrane-bound serine protease (ClpP class) [Rhodothermus profundi]